MLAVNAFVRQQLRLILPAAPSGSTREDLLAVTALIEAGKLTRAVRAELAVSVEARWVARADAESGDRWLGAGSAVPDGPAVRAAGR
jgi:hypothetical protein